MFNKLSSREHMVLLMLYHGVEIPKQYMKDLRGLEEATLIHKQNVINENKVVTTYSINKRGIAFVHQQRDPYDLRKFETASLHFLTKLQRFACEEKALNKVHDAIFGDAIKALPEEQKELQPE